MTERVLGGGAVNEVVRIGATVRRTPTKRSAFVGELLALFESDGRQIAPRFLGTDERGREIFRYIEGRAAVTARERAAARTDEALAEVAQLVRAFHDLTHGTPLAGDQDVVCHNDLAPKNTVYTVCDRGWRPVAFIDWDLAAPGARIHDIAHVCWQYLGLGPDITDVPETARRIRLSATPTASTGGTSCWTPCCGGRTGAGGGSRRGSLRGEPAMAGLRAQGAVDEVRAAWTWVAARRHELGAFLD